MAVELRFNYLLAPWQVLDQVAKPRLLKLLNLYTPLMGSVAWTDEQLLVMSAMDPSALDQYAQYLGVFCDEVIPFDEKTPWHEAVASHLSPDNNPHYPWFQTRVCDEHGPVAWFAGEPEGEVIGPGNFADSERFKRTWKFHDE